MPKVTWEAAALRAALFTQRALPLTTDVFSILAGEPPDRQEDRPKEGVRRQFGRLDDADFFVEISPIRVDIVTGILSMNVGNIVGNASLTMGEFEAQVAKFERRILAWLPEWEIPTTRLAFVAQARAPTASVEASYEVLRDSLTSVRVRPGEMSDLIFRVNWKAKTDLVPEGYFNRLSTWSAATFVVAAGIPGGPEIPLPEQHWANLEMDINTPSERTDPLPREKLTAIFSEIIQLAVNITEVGEGP